MGNILLPVKHVGLILVSISVCEHLAPSTRYLLLWERGGFLGEVNRDASSPVASNMP